MAYLDLLATFSPRLAWTLDGESHRNARLWDQAAEQLGLKQTQSFQLRGELRGFRIEVVNRGPRLGAGRTVLTVRSGEINHLRILPRAVGDAAFAALIAESTVPTKDAAFDEQLTVFGDVADALALLSPSTRARLRVLTRRYEGEVFRGGVRLVQRGGFISAEQLVAFLEDGLELAERMTLSPECFVQRLWQGLTEELSSSRLQRLFRLFLARTTVEEREVYLEKAAKQRNPELRFLAARSLGPRGAPTMTRLYRDRSLPGSIRAGALAYLADEQPRKIVAPKLTEALADRSTIVVKTAAGILGRWRHRPALDGLLGAAQYNTSAEVLVAVARALGRLESLRALSVLMGLLDHPQPAVVDASVRALSQIGSPLAVVALRRLQERAVIGSRLRYEAREAIRSIQKLNPSQGALSLPRPAGGAISVSKLAEGALSETSRG